MDTESVLSAGQIVMMVVVIAVSLATWLIAVILAAREPRGTSAAANAGPREEHAAEAATRLPSDDTPAGRAAV